MQRLSPDDVKPKLARLKDWTLEDGVLKKDFGFKGFRTAIEFINRLVPLAEKLDHHPEWTNSYNRVQVNLTTHSAHGLTKNDFTFAEAADEVAAELRH